jgi:predicted nucleic acid-binding protein
MLLGQPTDRFRDVTALQRCAAQEGLAPRRGASTLGQDRRDASLPSQGRNTKTRRGNLRNRVRERNAGGDPPTARAWLTIPTSRETIDSFVVRLRELIASPGTHLYVDTSFLVWLTALGKEARAEFTTWIDRAARDRFHVPVWSAHEYLRHHVKDLHGTKLTEVAKNLTRVADEAFGTLRPYLDSQIVNDPRPVRRIDAENCSRGHVRSLAEEREFFRVELKVLSSRRLLP